MTTTDKKKSDETARPNAPRPPRLKTGIEALVTGVALAAALILLNVFVSNVRSIKVDLTENEIYTLSQASRDMVAALDERVNIKFYAGNVPVAAADKEDYIDALLAEYADASGGKISYEKIDPTGDTARQEELKKEGIDKIRLRSIEDDKREEVKMYFHVVFSYLDKKKEIWKPEGGFGLEGLEYEYSSRIKRLARGKKKVCVTTGFGEPPRAQILALEGREIAPGVRLGLGDLYEVTPCDWAKDPKSIDTPDVVIVNGPVKVVSEAAKYHLDQRIMTGRPTLFLVKGVKWEMPQQQPGLPPELMQDQPFTGMPNESGLNDLLMHYGFKVNGDILLDPRNTAYGMVPPGNPQGGLARGLFPLAKSFQSGPREMLANIDFMVVPWASSISLVGRLEKEVPPGFDVIPILRTMPTSFAREGILPLTRDFVLKPNEKDKQGPHLVAVAASGKWTSYYADKPVPDGAVPPGSTPFGEDGAPAVPPAEEDVAPGSSGETVKESPDATRLMIMSAPAFVEDVTFGDMRAHQDRTYLNGFVGVHGLVDWLAEDTALVAARNKVVERPLEDVEKGTKTALKVGNIAGPPVAIILAGIAAWLVRENRRRKVRL